MTYIYVDTNQWEMLLATLSPEQQKVYTEDRDLVSPPTHRGRPVIMMVSYYKAEQGETVGFVRETTLDDE